MPRKAGLVRLCVWFAVLASFGIAALRVSVLPSTLQLNSADLKPRSAVENPFHVLISCETREQYGEAVYGGDAPVFALFAGCKPQGDFSLFAEPSTVAEACATKNQPEVAFELTESGEVKNIALIRGSGNSAVDRKVQQMIRDKRYPATKCGACTVFARVPVSLNCP